MRHAKEIAQYFLKEFPEYFTNTYDGNMKLQKLITFSDLIFFALKNERLFEEEVLAYKNGCVVEPIRQEYKHNYRELISESQKADFDFSSEEAEALDLTVKLFGHLSASELSDINHQFSFWKLAHDRSDTNGYYHKERSCLDYEEVNKEIDKIRMIINSQELLSKEKVESDIINGITFYFDDDFEMTDERAEQLYEFSQSVDSEEDHAFFVYVDPAAGMVIY